jgi:hypothetical protein
MYMQILDCSIGKEIKVKKTSVTKMCLSKHRGEGRKKGESAMTFTLWWGGPNVWPDKGISLSATWLFTFICQYFFFFIFVMHENKRTGEFKSLATN